MGSFYGGREGHSFIITRTFESVKEMVEKFKMGSAYTEVHFDEYVLINSPNKANPENGQIFRRGYDYDGTRKIKTYNKAVKDLSLGTFTVEEIESGGAIYIGTIVGPAGRAPVFNFTSKEMVKQLENYARLHINSLDDNSKPGSLDEAKELFDKLFANGVPADVNKNAILNGATPTATYHYLEFTMYDSGNQEVKYYFYNDNISYPTEDSIGWYLIDTKITVLDSEYTVNNKHLVPGVVFSGYETGADGQKHKKVDTSKYTNGYNDTLQWSSCSIRTENNEDTIAYVGFRIPYPVFEYEAKSVDAYYDRSDTITISNPTDSQKTNNFNNLNLAEEVSTGHPFHVKWNFKIPKGIKGDSIKNVRVIEATSNVVVFDLSNGELQYNTNGSIKTKAYDGRDDDVTNKRKIIVYDYYCYDRLPAGEHHLVYLGDFNKIDDITFAQNGTVTVDYSHDNTLTKDKLLTWMTGFTLNESTGALEVTFNNDKIANISKSLQWVKDITLDSDGTLTTDYTNIDNRVENKKINWIQSCSFNNDTGALSITFNNDNNANISKTLNYIKKIEIDGYNHLLVTHSDPAKGVQDLGGIGEIMIASENDSDLANKKNKLNTGGVWFITKEV